MTRLQNRRNNGAWRIFRWPLSVAVASLIGLVSALIGDGWHDGLSWLLLGGLLVLILTAYRRPA